jgi:ornithine decarboxylase
VSDLKTHELDFAAEQIGALKYETPYFLFSKRRLRMEVDDFRRHIPGAAIHYAMKANSDPTILRVLFDVGCNFEAASCYELHALRAIGVLPDRIIYGTSVKPAAHIREFFEYGVDRFACDSQSELEKIAACAPGSRVFARLSVNDGESVFRFSEKFGTDKASAVSLLKEATTLGLQPHGLSFHVGSQSRDCRAFGSALREVRETMILLAREGIRIEMLNLGGGFPCLYAGEPVPDLKEIGAEIAEGLERLPYQPNIIIEPGRAIVAEAGVLVASVIARVPRGGATWLFLDAGVYNGLFEAMAYQGSTRYAVEPVRASVVGEALFQLAGPTGDAPDVIARDVPMSADIAVGDKVIVRSAGAYSLSVTSEFNGFPKPLVYWQ